MSQIIIQLHGGLVADVFIKGTGKPTTAVIVDEDTESASDDNITSVTIGDKTKRTTVYEACIHTEKIKPLPLHCDIRDIVKEYSK